MNVDIPGIGYSYAKNTLHEDVDSRTLEIPQCTRIFKANHGLKVHNKGSQCTP